MIMNGVRIAHELQRRCSNQLQALLVVLQSHQNCLHHHQRWLHERAAMVVQASEDGGTRG